MTQAQHPTEALTTLARAGRILARHGFEDMTLGHMSLRDPDGRGAWMKRRGPSLSELDGPDDFLLVGWDGEVLDGAGRRHSEWPLHTEILAARPDLMVGIHSHPRHATLVSSLEPTPLTVTQDGFRILGAGLARFDGTPDLIRTRDEGRAVADALGSGSIVLLKNHGVSIFAESAPKLALLGIYLERACEAALTARATGLAIDASEADQAPLLVDSAFSDAFIADNWAYLERQLDRAEGRPSNAPPIGR